MRILAVKRTPPWPLASGQNLPTYHLLSRLAVTHEVTMACWEESAVPQQLPWPGQLVRRCLPDQQPRLSILQRSVACRFGLFPATIPWLGPLLDEVQPDVIFGVDYQSLMSLAAYRQVARVAYLIDNRWLQARDDFKRVQGGKLSQLKSLFWSYLLHRCYGAAAEVCVFVTERDARAFQGFGSAPCVAVPNGVDTEAFCPGEAPREHNVVLFVGSLNFPPNVEAVDWFCREVWPLVRQEQEGVRLRLVGKQPVAEVRVWHGREGIEVMGDVPDVVPYLQSTTMGVAPMRSGGGIKNKILEGWAAGVPLVATSMSLQALCAEPERNILVADQPAEFARQVLRVLRDPGLGERLASRGRKTVLQQHSWDQAADQLEQCLIQARQRHAGQPTGREAQPDRAPV